MSSKNLKFPEGFLWGAATSAHQVEGGNRNDWTEWEKKNAERLADEAETKWQARKTGQPSSKFPEMNEAQNYISGKACDHYNRYEEDFDIAKSLNLNAFRISIEWSRIEPEEGKFDEQEIEHYRQVLEAIRTRGMEPFVTLWHWTLPLWLSDIGGISNKKFPFYFERFSKKVAKEYHGVVNYWLTMSEPTALIGMGYLSGIWPPQKKNPLLALQVFKNLGRAHNAASKVIHQISSSAQVGFVNILNYFDPFKKKSYLDKLSVIVADYFSNKKFFNLTKNNDFLAVDYYFHHRLGFPAKKSHARKNITDMGWEIYPEGIYHVLKDLKKYNLPIYITENGLADADDKKREKFIRDHLCWVYKAISEGADVRGYFYWSLLDNFEWDKGFWPRFGLVEMDYKTMGRKIRPSAREYAKICKNNSLEI